MSERGKRKPEFMYDGLHLKRDRTMPSDHSLVPRLATIGNEGLVGHYGLGGTTSPRRVIVQIENGGLRIVARAVQEESEQNMPLKELLGGYHIVFISQVYQSVACNGCTRWCSVAAAGYL
jgi:hypothetical protein